MHPAPIGYFEQPPQPASQPVVQPLGHPVVQPLSQPQLLSQPQPQVSQHIRLRNRRLRKPSL